MKYRLPPVVIIGIGALVIRLLYCSLMPPVTITNDALEYHTIAVNLSHGDGFSINPGVPTPVRAPLYPLFLSFLYRLFGPTPFAVQAMQSLLDALTCMLIYYLAKSLSPKIPAPLAASLYALYPPAVFYTRLIMSETLFTFMLIVAMLMVCRGIDRRNVLEYAAGGVCMGLSTLTRPTTLLLPFVIAVFFVFIRPRLLPGILLFCLAAVATVAPWTLRNFRVYGVFMPVSTGGASNTWTTGFMVKNNVSWGEAVVANQARMKELMFEPEKILNGYHPRIELDRQLMIEGKEMIAQHRSDYLQLLVRRFPAFWFTSHSSACLVDRPLNAYMAGKTYWPVMVRLGLFALHTVLLLIAVYGIAILWKAGYAVLVPMVTLVYFTGHIAFDPCPRFHIPVMPYVILFAATAITGLITHARKISRAPVR